MQPKMNECGRCGHAAQMRRRSGATSETDLLLLTSQFAVSSSWTWMKPILHQSPPFPSLVQSIERLPHAAKGGRWEEHGRCPRAASRRPGSEFLLPSNGFNAGPACDIALLPRCDCSLCGRSQPDQQLSGPISECDGRRGQTNSGG